MGASGQREEGTRRSRCPARASSLRSSSFSAHDSPDGNAKETEFDRWLEWMEEREKGEREREESLQYQECKFWEPDSLPKERGRDGSFLLPVSFGRCWSLESSGGGLAVVVSEGELFFPLSTLSLLYPFSFLLSAPFLPPTSPSVPKKVKMRK